MPLPKVISQNLHCLKELINDPGSVVCVSNTSTWEFMARDQELEASLGYIVRPPHLQKQRYVAKHTKSWFYKRFSGRKEGRGPAQLCHLRFGFVSSGLWFCDACCLFCFAENKVLDQAFEHVPCSPWGLSYVVSIKHTADF